MNVIEQQILGNLMALESAVARMPASNPKPDLVSIFARIDELARQLPPGTDPELLHFLQRKSYQKARALLQQQQTVKV